MSETRLSIAGMFAGIGILLCGIGGWMLTNRMDLAEKRITALEQARDENATSGMRRFGCSPPATFEDDGKLYECVAKDTWRLKEGRR